jgi:sulfite reductase beta subunit-like hemoprotein
MAKPNIPAAKRAGLTIDLERLSREGDAWLSPDDRYTLKTYGVCPQIQPGQFMVRVRVTGGTLPTWQARAVAQVARRHAEDWLHVTTRQSLELHWVQDRDVTTVLDALAAAQLSTRSACGHTLRNVMCSEDAGVGFDEPFDCFADARLVSDAILARSATLNCELPSRINMAFGGSPRCREDALINDAAFVSVVEDGRAGYELWAGGSLGKSPALAIRLSRFLPRDQALAAAEALTEVFCAHGDIDNPARGRMKYAVAALGEDGFRSAWDQAFVAALERPHPEVAEVEVLSDDQRASVLAHTPPGGWSVGVRPHREAGMCSVTVDLPLGDANGAELELFADLADRYGDGFLTLTRDQNITFRNVAVADVTTIRLTLAARGLAPLGEGRTAQVRACVGSQVCAIGITDAPTAAGSLAAVAALTRNAALRVHVSGCPNSCAQHQVADIGLAGSKVRVDGTSVDGYQVYLGADLDRLEVGEVVGRVATADLPLAVEAIVGAWEALRHPGEPLGRCVRRFGLDAFSAQVASALADRWAIGPEPTDPSAAGTSTAAGSSGVPVAVTTAR